jgi:hypothetical protein
MAETIIFLAGRKAYQQIRDGGLDPDMVRVLAGAAGGPKWLVLSSLDRAVFSQFFGQRTQPLFLLGSSIGAWRFAMACRQNPVQALYRFEYAYIHQSYSPDPTPEEVTRETLRIQQTCLSDGGLREVIDHPLFRLNILAVRAKGPLASDHRLVQGLGLAASALLNVVSRRTLGLFFERTLFSDPRDIPPFFNMSQFPIHKTPLSVENLRLALLASGSIPLVMSGVTDIPGASRGVYRDGGVIDYHLNIPLMGEEDGLVLFPHYSSRLIPSWFDKHLFWRKPSRKFMESVLVVAPGPDLLSRLPDGRIPDRNDFYRFKGRDKDRIEQWGRVVGESRRLADDFMDAVASGRIRDMVRPMF